MLAVLLSGLAWVVARELWAAAPRRADRATGNASSVAARGPEMEAVDRSPDHVPSVASGGANHAPVRFKSLASIARHLVAQGVTGSGLRTLIAGEAPHVAARSEAMELARRLARMGRHVVCIDWSMKGRRLPAPLGAAAACGMTEVLLGKATFEDVVRRMPGSEAHYIGAGAASLSALDGDRVGMVLDALDEVYDHILITGDYDDLAELFAAIEGRIDVGVLIAAPEQSGCSETTHGFLGFEVADLGVIHYEPEPRAGLGLPPRRVAGDTRAP
jgi:hypothetical protein